MHIFAKLTMTLL